MDKGAIAQSITECEDFLALCDREGSLQQALEYQTLEHIMHDFWLTRNGHGAGFWEPGDYGWSDLGDKLTEFTKHYGEVNLYVGDDGTIYAY